MISITREEKLRAGEAGYTKSTEEAESGAKALDAARDELAAGRLEFERSQAEMEASELYAQGDCAISSATKSAC